MVLKILDRIAPKRQENFECSDENLLQRIETPTLFGDPKDKYKMEFVWRNIIVFIYLHFTALNMFFIPEKYSYTSHFLAWITGVMSALGTTIGAHRYYTHRSFKANSKLRILLLVMQTMAVQNSMYEWVRDHRVHHKYTDTNADPHNSQRGFFFSHMGWLCCKKHPEVIKFGKKIDMSDLENDKFVMFQHKYYLWCALLLGFVLPIGLACFFGESFRAVWFGHIFRYCMGLHLTWMINSAAHCFGNRPFDKSLSSSDSKLIGTIALGEGWHNYHHVFPWDYKTSEMPYYEFNISLMMIDFFAWLGWATELKTVSQEMINKRAQRTGDGTHRSSLKSNNKHGQKHEAPIVRSPEIWGWDDKELNSEDKKLAVILHATIS